MENDKGVEEVITVSERRPLLETCQLALMSDVLKPSEQFDWSIFSRYDPQQSPFTLVALDVNHLSILNNSYGHDAGDEALRWFVEVLAEESGVPVYRTGGDEFVLIFKGEDRERHLARTRRIIDRLDGESSQVKLNKPVATVAAIHYAKGGRPFHESLIGDVYAALDQAKADPEEPIKVIDAYSFHRSPDFQWVIRGLAKQLNWLASKLDEMHHLAHTDQLTGLPNLRAAIKELDMAMIEARLREEPLSILMIDGDDLKRYNKINYSAGDEMIQKLSSLQKNHIRTGDFIARWRMGDEFLMLMPATPVKKAYRVGERIREAVERESKNWIIPVTISAGLATYPHHGETLNELLARAEEANQLAKSMGKNRIEVAREK